MSAASQGCSELVGFVYQCGFLVLLPGEVPLFLATLGDGVAVDSGPQVGMDPGMGGGVRGGAVAGRVKAGSGEDR